MRSKLRKILLIPFLTILVISLPAQRANFEWAKQMRGTDLSRARGLAITTDAFGNVYTTELTFRSDREIQRGR